MSKPMELEKREDGSYYAPVTGVYRMPDDLFVPRTLIAGEYQVMPPCGAFVMWWDGEYEGECELQEGHAGHHFDGVSCYEGESTGAEQVSDCPDHRS